MVGECVVEAGCFDEKDFGRFLEGCAAASMEASTGGVDPAPLPIAVLREGPEQQ